MKYVLMYTNRPTSMPQYPKSGRQRSTRLSTAVQEAWLCHGRQRRRTAGPRDSDDCQVRAEWWRTHGRGRPVFLGEGECRRVQHDRRSRPHAAIAIVQYHALRTSMP